MRGIPGREIVNAAGERERERWSARTNLAEVAVVYALISLAVWVLIGELGRSSRAAEISGYALLAACLFYALVLAPLVHGDAGRSWGLVSPRANLRTLRELDGRGRRAAALLAVAALSAVLVVPGWRYLLIRLGIRRTFHEAYQWLTAGSEGVVLALAFGALVVFPLLVLLIRWDNLFPTLGKLLPVALLVWIAAPLALWAHGLLTGTEDWMGRIPLLEEDGGKVLKRGIFYLLWGTLQEYCALGYFNGRLRKGFGSRRYGPLSGRALAALATGVIFGLSHLPSPALAAATLAGGTFLGWHFQRDRTRNLFVMGLLHGVSGVLFAVLVPTSMGIGPWR